MDLRGKKALVTGASAGIGRATVTHLLQAGAAVTAVARRADRLALAKKEWAKLGEVDVRAFDIRDPVDLSGVEVDVLVNNAGLARGTDPMQSADVEDWRTMIDTNITGLLRMTRALLPAMVARREGHIVNLGSVAGRWVYPGGGVYAATKHAVRALSEGLRMDLHGTGIRVTNIEPGLVETEFSLVRFAGDQERARRVYAQTRPLSPDDIAETILWCLTRPAHVNVQELVLFPTDQAAVGMVHRTKS